MDARIALGYSVCPHDCPSTCALEIELLDEKRIGRVRGNKRHSYTQGIICAKVARYAERIHHPDRLTHPLRRVGAKGAGEFEPIAWDEALDEIAGRFEAAEAEFGVTSIWPYNYAGTMGLVMRDGIERLRHVKRYSRQNSTICANLSYAGYTAGTGKLAGADSREMAKSDLVVIWGTNPVNTQVNVMTHAVKARRERGAKIVAVDVYRNGTVEQADMAMILRPGTDAALACAVMHVLFRDGHADREYLAKYADAPAELEAHLRSRGPDWASPITGLPVAEIEAFAKLIGERKRAFFRLGFGFTRSRNGAVNMHAASCIPVVSGAWQHEGGGALHSQGGLYHWNKALIEASEHKDASIRAIDMSRIGPALTGDPYDLAGGPPVKAMIVQSTNPMAVAPEQRKVRAGFAREDLFVAVHEHFMTETARMADIVLPATMFLEHDDIYQASGHSTIQFGGKLVEAPGECRSNHDVICALARRLGAEHPGFQMSPRELIDATLQASGWCSLAELEQKPHGHDLDVHPDFRSAHYLNGFNWPDKKFRFKPQWTKVPSRNEGVVGPAGEMPSLPDHWEITEQPDAEHPFRLATSPARAYLNSSFGETKSSNEKHGSPEAMMHPDDLARLGIANGQRVVVGNQRGEIRLRAKPFAGLRPGVVVIESIPPNAHFEGGEGVNTLTSADQGAPYGGAVFHDTRVWVRAG